VSVREGLLSLLEDGPSYGFHLKTRFEEVTGGVWPLNAGQVYTTLDRLQRDGLIEVDESGSQKTYTLTDEGEQELGAWWDAVPGDDPPPRDELLIKTLLALPHGRDHALAVISRQRTALVKALQSRRSAHRGEGGARPLAEELVADAVLMRAEADLRWLDRCEARLAAATDDEVVGAGETGAAPPGQDERTADRPAPRRPRGARTRRTAP
jgi:DNA-binding PadR family transcriptional regulator